MDTEKIGKRNYILMTLEGSLFFSGLAFLGENTVVPIFVDTYTGSMQLLGLTITLLTAAKLLPRLLMGPYISKVKDMARFLHITMLINRPLPLLMIPVLLIVNNPLIIFIIFVLMYCTFWSVNGIAATAWLDIFGRTIPGKYRGKLQGHQQFIGGIASIGAGYIIKLLLDNSTLSNNIKYLIIFTLGGLVLLGSAIAIAFVKDIPRKVKEEKVVIIKYFLTLPSYLKKNKDYREMNIIQAISRFGDLIIPFIIVLSKNNLGFDSYKLSTLVVFQVIGAMLGGILWGNISHRFGNKQVIVTVEIIGLVISLATFLSVLSNTYVPTFPIMCVVSILAGAKTGGWLGYGNYLIDIVEKENIIDTMILSTIILFPLSFANYFAGLATDLFGFLPLLVFSVIVSVSTTTLSVRLKDVKHL